ncbi:hypothetical protein [Streptomyces calidiresistens]|uniref:Uncharacterized protein n=1 Tax=Streptomyces calidiresistens TaxID=1485586 RepID=A0A7W3XVS6_9ACTN|nr:hypothetical protein [Streptomyces calidiresistens]MBB0229119.1 hypothetical protein [Streptomyces calidiresistens]
MSGPGVPAAGETAGGPGAALSGGADTADGGTPRDDDLAPAPAGGVVCCNCERRTTAPTPVRYVQTMSGPGFILYACPQCVLSVPHGPLPDDVP